MPIPNPQPASEQGNPYIPPGPPEPLIFEMFEGIDTSTTRVGVDDKKMAWCSGFFPIEPRMLRTMPGVGPTLWTTPSASIVFYGFANIGATPIAVVFLADGSVWQVNTVTGASVNILGTNTILNPSVLTTGMTQWGSTYVLIVNKQTNGYFVWDGTLAYYAGTLAPIVTLTNAGSGYTSAPTVAASGGHGTGATFVATINTTGGVTGVTVTSDAGPNYNFMGQAAAGPVSATVLFSGGGGSGATGTVNLKQVSNTGGVRAFSVSSITVTNPGSGYGSAPTVMFSTANLLTSGTDPFNGTPFGPPILTALVGTTSPVTGVTITNPGTGYQAGDTVTLAFSGGAGSGAAATVTLMPFAIGGTGIETFQQRVWIINGALLQFGVAGSVSNFATSSGGGSVTSNDSFLRVGYTRLIQTSGFLYLIGDSSMNYISGVQTTGSPPTTTFTNQNADPEVGTPYPSTADVFGRNIVFANSFGAHASFGAAVVKISFDLDGVYSTQANFGGQQLSSAKATVFSKKIWVLLVPIIDPVTGLASNELFCWDGQKKWWSTKQDSPLTFIQYQEINSVLTAWGTDGVNLFPLFQAPSIAFTKTVQSKLWTKPGGYQFTKSTTRFWGLAQYYDSRSQNINLTIDSEYSAQPYTLTPPNVAMLWTEDGVTPMTWTEDGVTPMTWSLGGVGIRVFDPQAVGQQGVLTGMTASTSAADVAIISLMQHDEIVQYRG